VNLEKIVSEFLPAESPDALQHRKRGQTVVNLGLFCNIGLAAAKTTFGIVGHSTALLSDGINSTSDVAYYIVVKIFMKLAGEPPDNEHPYGHRQMESIAALTVGSFVITTAIAIFWKSINTVFDQFNGVADLNGATLGALSVALLTVLALYFFAGASLRGMAESQIIGIVIGTLSSIFVACPLLHALGANKQDLMPRLRDDAELARRP